MTRAEHGARYEDLHPRAQELVDKAARTKAAAERISFEKARELVLAGVIRSRSTETGVGH